MREVLERRMRRRWLGPAMAGLPPSWRAGTVSDLEDLRVIQISQGRES